MNGDDSYVLCWGRSFTKNNIFFCLIGQISRTPFDSLLAMILNLFPQILLGWTWLAFPTNEILSWNILAHQIEQIFIFVKN